jgi:cytochrome c peroxidase
MHERFRVRRRGGSTTLLALCAALASPVRAQPDAISTHAQTSWRQREQACSGDPRVRLGLTSQSACIGAELFFRESFDGNGRSCGSCHPPLNNFTLDADFIARLPKSDALFAAELDPKLATLERPQLLRRFGLILVNADGFEDLAHKFVMRSVSHTLSLSTSLEAPPPLPSGRHALDGTTLPPRQRTGWAGDGGDLHEFADTAIRQHSTRTLQRVSGVDFRLPTDAERDAITRFMLGLGRRRDIEIAEVRLNDRGAERGRVSFLEGPGQDCNGCHDNAGANSVLLDDAGGVISSTNFSFDVGTERIRPPLVDAHGVPFDGGFGAPPWDPDGDGVQDAFGNRAFNTPPLVEAPDTAPYFHTHEARTLEDAIRFYNTDAFGSSLSGSAPTLLRPKGGPMQLSEDEIADLGRFLRVLNAAFNGQLAALRLEAALAIERRYKRRHRAIGRGLLELADAEIDDAIEVLRGAAQLNRDVQDQLQQVRRAIRRARSGRGASAEHLRSALAQLQRAQVALGMGLDFELGESNVLF